MIAVCNKLYLSFRGLSNWHTLFTRVSSLFVTLTLFAGVYSTFLTSHPFRWGLNHISHFSLSHPLPFSNVFSPCIQNDSHHTYSDSAAGSSPAWRATSSGAPPSCRHGATAPGSFRPGPSFPHSRRSLRWTVRIKLIRSASGEKRNLFGSREEATRVGDQLLDVHHLLVFFLSSNYTNLSFLQLPSEWFAPKFQSKS